METIQTLDPRAFRGLICSVGVLPTSFIESMSYYEMIAWLVNYIKVNVIPTVNGHASAIKEIQNWIETLDLQEYVDAKLDEMSESGELAEIIAQYVQLAAVLAYQTIADMSGASNLVEGSICRVLGNTDATDGDGAYYLVRELTNQDVIDGVDLVALTNQPTLVAERIIGDATKTNFLTVSEMVSSNNLRNGDIAQTAGYYSANDGGGADYIITDTLTANGMDKIALDNGLFAELIKTKPLNVKKVGAKGDGVQDDFNYLQRAIDMATEIFIPAGDYLVSDGLHCQNKVIKGENFTSSTIIGTAIEDEDTPILRIGLSTSLDNLCVSYSREKIASFSNNDTAGIGLALYGGYTTNHGTQHSSITNFQTRWCNTGISDLGSSPFSVTFDNVLIYNSKRAGLRFTSGTRTGNVYTNIYISNIGFVNYGEDDTYSCNYGFFLGGEESECTITQLNVEHMSCYAAVRLENIRAFQINSLHIEGVKTRSNYQGFVYLKNSYGNIDAISFYYTRHTTGTELFRLEGLSDTSSLQMNYPVLNIGVLECKGLNRPDLGTFGAEQPGLTGLSNNYFFFGVEGTAHYKINLNGYNYYTFSGNNDTTVYEDMPSLYVDWIKRGQYSISGSTANRPNKRLFPGMCYYDTTLNKLITYSGTNWRDGSGSAV